MDFRQLRYAIAVGKEGSFTKAAERLNISQSAVSEQVKLLEEQLGFPLLDRTGRSAEMTERGRVFLYEAERIASDFMHLTDVARRLRDSTTESVRIGIISGLAPILLPRLFRDGGIPASIRLEVRTAPTRVIFDDLHNGGLDLGFAIAVDPGLVPTGITTRRLFDTELVLITQRGHPIAANGGPVEFALIAQEPMIMSELTVGYGLFLINTFGNLGLRPQIRAVVDNIETMKVMVRLGLGHALVPAGAASDEEKLGIVDVACVTPSCHITLNIYQPRQKVSKEREALCALILSGLDR